MLLKAGQGNPILPRGWGWRGGDEKFHQISEIITCRRWGILANPPSRSLAKDGLHKGRDGREEDSKEPD